jgi:hypothetical protein
MPSANAITCPVCNSTWCDRDTFIADRTVELAGYQPDFEELHLGLFLFNHAHCGNTIAVRAGFFQDLQTGPVFENRKPAGTECPGHCVHRGNFEKCPARCECNYVRTVLLKLKTMMEHPHRSP